MTLIIHNFRNGYKFFCPIKKFFYGPFFNSKESIEDFLNWYDDDIRYIGTWLSDCKEWNDLILEWKKTNNGKNFNINIKKEEKILIIK